jgi:hypothetical protein
MTLKDRLAKYMRNKSRLDRQRPARDWCGKKQPTRPRTPIGVKELQNGGVLEVQIRRGHAWNRVAQKELTLSKLQSRFKVAQCQVVSSSTMTCLMSGSSAALHLQGIPAPHIQPNSSLQA